MIYDEFPAALPSLERRAREQARDRRIQGRELVAAEWRALLGGGAVPSRSALARRMGVSRARVSQVLSREGAEQSGAGTAARVGPGVSR